MKILLLSCSTGEGHNHCALAVKEALDARDAARTVLAADPVLSAPEHAALRAQCARLFAANDGHFN